VWDRVYLHPEALSLKSSITIYTTPVRHPSRALLLTPTVYNVHLCRTRLALTNAAFQQIPDALDRIEARQARREGRDFPNA
jgi:hypothetical protein